jgi:uncharacterized membrane protein
MDKKVMSFAIIGILSLLGAMLIFSMPVLSAVITGSVYGPDFDTLNDTVIRINTQPIQQILARNGTYEFNVPEGSYELNAYYKGTEDDMYVFSEKIDAKGDGRYVLDIIMLPEIDDGITPYPEGFYDSEPASETGETAKPDALGLIMIGGIIALSIAAIIFYFARKKKADFTDENAKTKNTMHAGADESYDKILELINKNKRMTQKDITKEMFLSDAKVSLVLTEMESRGIIKKIKKGRTNVIILNK